MAASCWLESAAGSCDRATVITSPGTSRAEHRRATKLCVNFQGSFDLRIFFTMAEHSFMLCGSRHPNSTGTLCSKKGSEEVDVDCSSDGRLQEQRREGYCQN